MDGVRNHRVMQHMP